MSLECSYEFINGGSFHIPIDSDGSGKILPGRSQRVQDFHIVLSV